MRTESGALLRDFRRASSSAPPDAHRTRRGGRRGSGRRRRRRRAHGRRHLPGARHRDDPGRAHPSAAFHPRPRDRAHGPHAEGASCGRLREALATAAGVEVPKLVESKRISWPNLLMVIGSLVGLWLIIGVLSDARRFASKSSGARRGAGSRPPSCSASSRWSPARGPLTGAVIGTIAFGRCRRRSRPPTSSPRSSAAMPPSSRPGALLPTSRARRAPGHQLGGHRRARPAGWSRVCSSWCACPSPPATSTRRADNGEQRGHRLADHHRDPGHRHRPGRRHARAQACGAWPRRRPGRTWSRSGRTSRRSRSSRARSSTSSAAALGSQLLIALLPRRLVALRRRARQLRHPDRGADLVGHDRRRGARCRAAPG